MSRHVQMPIFKNTLIRFDMILQTCPDMFRHVIIAYDMIWYDSTNILCIWYSSTIFLNTYDVIWYNRIISCRSWNSHVNMSRRVWTCPNYNMKKFNEIWVNGTRNADDKAIPWTASTSERSKTKFSINYIHMYTNHCKNT